MILRNLVEEYFYEEVKGKAQILFDFDNTVVVGEWPYIGKIIPGAIEVLKELQRNGHMLILFTLRSYSYPVCSQKTLDYSKDKYGVNMGTIDILTPAIELLNNNGIHLYDINRNHTWEEKISDNCRKIFSTYCIDDHNACTPYIIKETSDGQKRKVVDWISIDKWCVGEGLYAKCVLS